MRPTRRFASFAFFLLLLCALPARSERRLTVEGESSCPAPQQVSRELAPLLREWRLGSGVGAAAVARVEDRGQSFTAEVLDVTRTIDDPSRDCAERARVAAVFLSMVLEPPIPTAKSAQRKPHELALGASGPQQPKADRGPTWSLRGRLGLHISGSPGAGVAPGPGPELGISVHRGRWFVRSSLAVVSWQTFDVPGATLEVRRFPLSLVVGRSFTSGSWAFDTALGVAVEPFLLASDVEQSRRAIRLNAGPGLYAGVSWQKWALYPFFNVGASMFPRTYQLIIEPIGRVGEFPAWWISASLGLEVEVL